MEEVLVVDLGSQSIRFGLNTEGIAKVIYIHYSGIEVLNVFGQEKVITHKFNPIERGKVIDWQRLQDLFEEAIEKIEEVTRFTKNERSSIIVTHSMCKQTSFPFHMEQLLFEYFNFGKVVLCNRPLMCLISSSKTSGCVIESGAEVTQICCYHQCKVLEGTAMFLDIGGVDVTANFNKRFKTDLIDLDVVKKAYLLEVVIDTNARGIVLDTKNYTLPDNTILTIGPNRVLCGEVLFEGDSSITKWLERSIDNSILHDFKSNEIHLYGGTTQLTGFFEKVRHYVSKCSTDKEWEVIPHDSEMPSFDGACMFSALSLFQSHSVLSKSYEECGTFLFEI
ncbi:actin, spherule isoform, putative [Entamoeba invadens IP1]|uniref:Actin, spherule isoform, putative n=1 Tax=Entamoeba invadens IP1 TaxID=370355 RepID=A0A0A1TXB1_ENTIV|nr:actin, spherule isoform, putative [Entamoeba invadens IP1]ELP85912.1 actin, spherule isoform, putative [Entamoeba invadens IP1]|eukprot:XP_004185258.1 actin, spherule isoform, putative [Entamoeba invadens IP1]